MVTYKVVQDADESCECGPGDCGHNIVGVGSESFSVIVKESGVVVVSGLTRNMALAEANLRASQAPGNRVES